MQTSLYLFPLPVPGACPDMDGVVLALQQQMFMGEEFAAGRYLVGKNFFDYLSFAGCSPHVPLEPEPTDDLNFAHFSVHWDLPPPPLLVAPQRGRPRCPACRGVIEDWKTLLPGWRRDAAQNHQCARCGDERAVAELDWRRYGVGSSCLIQIHRIYPGEAVPADHLLEALAAAADTSWDYAWAEAMQASAGNSSSMLMGK